MRQFKIELCIEGLTKVSAHLCTFGRQTALLYNTILENTNESRTLTLSHSKHIMRTTYVPILLEYRDGSVWKGYRKDARLSMSGDEGN